jgi:hypothetical protein
MGSEAEIKQPNQNHVDQRSNCNCVPHEGRNAGTDTEEAQPPILKELIELSKGRIVKRLLSLGLGLKKSKPRVNRRADVR